MTWGAVAVAAVGAVTAASSAASANKANAGAAGNAATQQYNAAAESYRGTELKYKQLQQDYAGVQEQNLMTQVRQNYRMGLMNVQKGMMAREATAKGFDTTQQAAAFLGAASANQAASQTVGASADAVKNDIRMKAGQAMATHNQNYSQQLQNFNSEVEALRLNNDAQFQSPKEILTNSHATLSDPVKVNTDYAYTNPYAAGAVAGIGSFAGSYLQGKTGLNLGATPAAAPAAHASPISGGDLGTGTYNMTGFQSNSSPMYGGWKID